MTKYCANCGTELEDDDLFCSNCGNATAPQEAATESGAAPANLEGLDVMVTQPVPPATVAAPAQTTAVMAPMPPQAVGTSASAPQNFQAAAAPAAPKNNKTAIIAAVVVAVVVVALVAAFLLLAPRGESDQDAPVSPSAQSAASQMCSVTYETGGGSPISASQVAAGEAITSPMDPVRNGYTFDGWFLDAGYTRPAAFPLTVEANTVLYAKWTPLAAQDASAAQAPSATSAPQASAGSDVQLTVTGADGAVRTATIHRQGNTQRVFPDSNTRLLSTSEIIALSDAERCVAWNEIIAASDGYEFKNSGLWDYFINDCTAWYVPRDGAAGGNLTSEGSKNVENLKRYTDDWWQHLSGQ